MKIALCLLALALPLAAETLTYRLNSAGCAQADDGLQFEIRFTETGYRVAARRHAGPLVWNGKLSPQQSRYLLLGARQEMQAGTWDPAVWSQTSESFVWNGRELQTNARSTSVRQPASRYFRQFISSRLAYARAHLR